MENRHATKMALRAILVLAVAALGAGSAASAEVRIPEEPSAAVEPAEPQATKRVLVSLGFDRRCGREAYTYKIGRRNGTSMC
jgi:hypothetical protein